MPRQLTSSLSLVFILTLVVIANSPPGHAQSTSGACEALHERHALPSDAEIISSIPFDVEFNQLHFCQLTYRVNQTAEEVARTYKKLFTDWHGSPPHTDVLYGNKTLLGIGESHNDYVQIIDDEFGVTVFVSFMLPEQSPETLGPYDPGMMAGLPIDSYSRVGDFKTYLLNAPMGLAVAENQLIEYFRSEGWEVTHTVPSTHLLTHGEDFASITVSGDTDQIQVSIMAVRVEEQ